MQLRLLFLIWGVGAMAFVLFKLGYPSLGKFTVYLGGVFVLIGFFAASRTIIRGNRKMYLKWLARRRRESKQRCRLD